MDFDAFKRSVARDAPPEGLPPTLSALWHAAKDDWPRAHALAQSLDDRDGAWVHAYLHRVEGDQSNAGYWYRRAGRPHCRASLPEEWEQIAREFLARP